MKDIKEEIQQDLDNGLFGKICSNENNFKEYVFEKLQSRDEYWKEKIEWCPCDFDWTIDDNLIKGYNMAMQEIQNWKQLLLLE